MNSIKLIEILKAHEGLKLYEIVKILSDKTGKKYNPKYFSGKIRRGMLRYDEADIIADALGYDLEPRKRPQ